MWLCLVLSGSGLKLIAILFMLIDHIAYCFLENVHTADNEALMYSLPQGELVDSLMRIIGRQAFPVFCFFLVEGFMKTRSRIRYFLRVLFFAVLSQYPFQKAFFPPGRRSPRAENSIAVSYSSSRSSTRRAGFTYCRTRAS